MLMLERQKHKNIHFCLHGRRRRASQTCQISAKGIQGAKTKTQKRDYKISDMSSEAASWTKDQLVDRGFGCLEHRELICSKVSAVSIPHILLLLTRKIQTINSFCFFFFFLTIMKKAKTDLVSQLLLLKQDLSVDGAAALRRGVGNGLHQVQLRVGQILLHYLWLEEKERIH